jgi:hypothetical protein
MTKLEVGQIRIWNVDKSNDQLYKKAFIVTEINEETYVSHAYVMYLYNMQYSNHGLNYLQKNTSIVEGTEAR